MSRLDVVSYGTQSPNWVGVSHLHIVSDKEGNIVCYTVAARTVHQKENGSQGRSSVVNSTLARTMGLDLAVGSPNPCTRLSSYEARYSSIRSSQQRGDAFVRPGTKHEFIGSCRADRGAASASPRRDDQ